MMMSDSISPVDEQIPFRFKGERDYVHGTDIYTSIANALLSWSAPSTTDNISAFRLAIRKPSHCNCRLGISRTGCKDNKPDSTVVEFQFRCDEQGYHGWLAETDSHVSERYEYCEDNVLVGCNINGKTAILENHAEYSAIEKVVTTTKLLHTAQFPDADGKWFFSRFDLATLLPTKIDQRITITLNQSLGRRLTRSEVKIDEQSIGNIFFSLVSA